jgi:hypothetical protein
MQRLEVSGAVRHIHIHMCVCVRRQRVNVIETGVMTHVVRLLKPFLAVECLKIDVGREVWEKNHILVEKATVCAIHKVCYFPLSTV